MKSARKYKSPILKEIIDSINKEEMEITRKKMLNLLPHKERLEILKKLRN